MGVPGAGGARLSEGFPGGGGRCPGAPAACGARLRSWHPLNGGRAADGGGCRREAPGAGGSTAARGTPVAGVSPVAGRRHGCREVGGGSLGAGRSPWVQGCARLWGIPGCRRVPRGRGCPQAGGLPTKLRVHSHRGGAGGGWGGSCRWEGCRAPGVGLLHPTELSKGGVTPTLGQAGGCPSVFSAPRPFGGVSRPQLPCPAGCPRATGTW